MAKKMPPLPEKINWTLLYTFLIIAEKKSLRMAAARLNVTQSAVSHSLRKLEAQTGAHLLDRSHRRFNLTEQGRILYEAALSMYRELGRLEDMLAQEGSSIAGNLHIMILSGVEDERFDEYLMRFRQRYPRIKLLLETQLSADILSKLDQGVNAIGITLCRREVKSLNRIFLLPQRYALYCGKHHPLFTKEKIRKQDLLSQNFVSWFSDQLGDVLSPLTVFREAELFTGEVVASINNIEELRRLIYLGYGIGCLPGHLAKKYEENGTLRRLPPEKGIADVPIYLAWNKQRRLKPAEVAFMSGLCQILDQEDAWRKMYRDDKAEK